MNYIDRYKRRLGRAGENVGEAYHRNTLNFINQTFHASPTYRAEMKVLSSKVDKEVTDGRVVEIERLGSLREVILRPGNDEIEVGMYLKIDDEWYMLIDKYGGTGSTNIKMLAIKINEELKWIDKDDVLQNHMCVASATDLGSKSKQSKNEITWNKFDVRLPVGQLFVSVEKNDETDEIGLNQRFIFGRNVYEIVGVDDITTVDDNGHGIIQYTAKITTKQAEDDFENGIAINKYKKNTGELDNPTDEGSGDGTSTEDGGSGSDDSGKDDSGEDKGDTGGRPW